MAWHQVADAAAIGDEEALGVSVKEVPVAICRSRGVLHAIHNVCTHEYAPLSEGWVEDGGIECPYHQARFDLATGEAQCAPASEPVKVYPIRIEDGKVFVELPD